MYIYVCMYVVQTDNLNLVRNCSVKNNRISSNNLFPYLQNERNALIVP